MLSEINAVKQDGASRKRWFRDDTFDLYLWQDAAGHITTLQLCYDRSDDQRILRWDKQAGYGHARVDSPEDKPGRAMSAILVADGIFPAELVLSEFHAAALQLPKDIVKFVEGKIRGYRAPASLRGKPRTSKPR